MGLSCQQTPQGMALHAHDRKGSHRAKRKTAPCRKGRDGTPERAGETHTQHASGGGGDGTRGHRTRGHRETRGWRRQAGQCRPPLSRTARCHPVAERPPHHRLCRHVTIRRACSPLRGSAGTPTAAVGSWSPQRSGVLTEPGREGRGRPSLKATLAITSDLEDEATCALDRNRPHGCTRGRPGRDGGAVCWAATWRPGGSR